MEEEHLVVGAICACSPFYAKANIEELEFYAPNINLTQESMKSWVQIVDNITIKVDIASMSL